ncbi:hypothetical protein ACKKBG_A02440 [Auxenochlorella protothecoides x Auxenochlorella symbiontica]
MSFLWGRPKAAAQPANPSGTEPQATKQSGKAQSLELVKYHAQTGKFEVGTEALRILRATAGPVGVVSVCGRARQGKSYILNQLLGRAGGFTVGPTHRPCTKGLWVWSAPVPRTAADGSPYHLVLLDTEGIDAYDQTGQYSTQIFSLAVLLSSLFVFNQMGGIDEAALDRLSLVTEMTKHIRVRAGGGEDASELAAFTPSFLWLLRDFYLTLEEDGRVVSPREYLESALAAVPGTGPGAAAKNAIRASIKSLFPDRDCFTLVRPVNEERELVSLDGLRPGDLRPEFREGLARLSALVFARARPKRLDSTVVTGPLLAGLVEAYVEAINAGAVPTIATAWQGVAEAESRGAADAAEAAYDAAWAGAAPGPEPAALDAAHARAVEAAAEAFAARALGPDAVKAANERRWREAVQARFAKARKEALASAALAVEQCLAAATKRVLEVAGRPDADPGALAAELAAAEAALAAAPGGAAKWQRWADWRRDVAAGAEARVAEAREARARHAAEGAAREAAEARVGVQAAAAEAQRLRAALGREAAARRGAEAAAAEAAAELERARRAARAGEEGAAAARAELMQARLDLGQAREALARAQAGSARGEGAAREAEAALARARGEAEATRREAEAAVGAARAEAQARATEAADLRRRVQELEAQAAGAEAALQAERARSAAAAVAATQAQANAFASPIPPSPPPAAGGAGRFAGARTVPSTPSAVEVKKMTKVAMQQWLTDAGEGATVYSLGLKNAKKAEYEAAVLDVLGSV